MIELRPEFRFSSQIRPILPGLRPFCLDLANFGRIWTILLGFGPYSLDLGPKGDKAEGGGGDRHTDGRTDSPCVLQDFVPFGAAALLPLNLHHFLLKQGTGTADHLLPLGCYFVFLRSLASLLLPK